MTQKPFTVGLLLCGSFTDIITEKHGHFGNLYRNLLDRSGHDVSCRDYWVMDNQYPNSTNECDAWLISGSRCDSFDNFPWLNRLKSFVRDCAASKTPIIGVCFGHQVMALALGGKVERSKHGWCLGQNTYKNTLLHCDMLLNAVHKDQVTSKPERSICVGQSDFCQFGALMYPGFGLSLQLHPEFTQDFVVDLINARRGIAFPDETADAALKLLSRPLKYTIDETANLFVRFARSPNQFQLAAA